MIPIDELPPPSAFTDFPGMRGLRIAEVAHADGKSLQIVEAVAGVVIPMATHPSSEKGKVLSGKIRFVIAGEGKVLEPGDVWEVPANTPQGPHTSLEDGTKVAILRDGKSAYDVS
jgi:quercetin dioxygenase-like cupin family protein